MIEQQLSSKETERHSISSIPTITTETIEARIDSLAEEFNNLNIKAESINKSVEGAEKRIQQTTTFLIFVAGAIIIAFFLSVIPIFLDYFKNNDDRYEKFINKIMEIERNNYSKQEINEFLNNYLEKIHESNKNLDDFKKCLKNGGWSKCF